MGIKAFWKCDEVKNATRAIAKDAELKGKRLAVDTSLYVQKFLRGMRDGQGAGLPNAVLKGFYGMCLRAKEAGVHLVFCLEGRANARKGATLQLRAAQSMAQRGNLMQMWEGLGGVVQQEEEVVGEQEEVWEMDWVEGEEHGGGQGEEHRANGQEAQEEEEKEAREAWAAVVAMVAQEEEGARAQERGEEQEKRGEKAEEMGEENERAEEEDWGAVVEYLEAEERRGQNPQQAAVEQKEQEVRERKDSKREERDAQPEVETAAKRPRQEEEGEKNGVEEDAAREYKEREREFLRKLRESGAASGAGMSRSAQCAVLPELARRFGFAAFASEGEGEATAALMSRLGRVDGVLTDDGDAAVMGAERVYRGVLGASAGGRSVLECGRLDRHWHARWALLVGCDYAPNGVANVGEAKARAILAAFAALPEDAALADEGERCVAPLSRFAAWLRDKESKRNCKLRRQLAKVELGPEWPEAAVARLLLAPCDDSEAERIVSAENLEEKEADVEGLVEFRRVFMNEDSKETEKRVRRLGKRAAGGGGEAEAQKREKTIAKGKEEDDNSSW